jgi:hypothetical protein
MCCMFNNYNDINYSISLLNLLLVSAVNCHPQGEQSSQNNSSYVGTSHLHNAAPLMLHLQSVVSVSVHSVNIL